MTARLRVAFDLPEPRNQLAPRLMQLDSPPGALFDEAVLMDDAN